MNTHDFYMKKAIQLAKKGIGFTAPNPCVGAIVVKNGEIVGKGYHFKAGKDHAEVIALKEAGRKAFNSTLYVSLEPCSHFGKTPPCVDSIIKSKVKTVVIGSFDPNPLTSKKGIKTLRNAGVEVVDSILEKQASDINKPFFKFITQKIPYVTLKVGMSLDGKITDNALHSKWITSSKARSAGQKIRKEVDAILVGANTVRKDNPLLTCRVKGIQKSLTRIIVSTTLDIPISSKMFASKKDLNPIIIFTTKSQRKKAQVFIEKGIEVVYVKQNKNGIDERALLKQLFKRGIMHVLIEGGASIASSFLSKKLVDRVVLFIAPKIFGGKKSLGAFDGLINSTVKKPLQLENYKIRRIGDDICIEGYPKY